MVPLTVGLCRDVYILADLILEDVDTSAVIASLLPLFFATLWFLLPSILRSADRGQTISRPIGSCQIVTSAARHGAGMLEVARLFGQLPADFEWISAGFC
jgi:hypothetical protein